MPLRCLIFSSNEQTVEPIWPVLAALGIDGEYCQSAVDAVEKVTTQMFQIVITDWDDQPEAAFLLKTARDLKAAQRPLTLAIVSDDARLPEALKAGANSVLVKPVRAEQVRDTMSTACELLRAKQSQTISQTGPPTPAVESQKPPGLAINAAAASFGAAAAPAPSFKPPSVTQSPEKTFRAGEFLHSASSAPGAQFATEDKEAEVAPSVEQAGAEDVDALTELEPTAAAVREAATEPAEPQQPLTGWAALQARLTKAAPAPVKEKPASSELLSYGETPSFGKAAEQTLEDKKGSAKTDVPLESQSEADLLASTGSDTASSELEAKTHFQRGRFVLIAMLAAACVVAAVPQTRRSVQMVFRSGVRAGRTWLNPPPAPVPQAAPQHDSFGQSGDEYNLPTATNIPDATTDPSQIRVLPVIDPTAKPEKGSANSVQTQTPIDGGGADQNQAGSNQAGPNQIGSNQTTDQAAVTVSQPGDSVVKESTAASVTDSPTTSSAQAPQVLPSAQIPQQAVPEAHAIEAKPRPPIAPLHTASTPPHPASVATNAGIPSSLKSQIASMAPAAGGNKPLEAAMSSIEPVILSEPAVRDLLTQPADPAYPAAARASGQRGSVVLQVLIGRDGAVQDAKFLQGSLVFARAGIDAVKQWHFKPYLMNGRTVSVQSVITLNFKPPA